MQVRVLVLPYTNDTWISARVIKVKTILYCSEVNNIKFGVEFCEKKFNSPRKNISRFIILVNN